MILKVNIFTINHRVNFDTFQLMDQLLLSNVNNRSKSNRFRCSKEKNIQFHEKKIYLIFFFTLLNPKCTHKNIANTKSPQ